MPSITSAGIGSGLDVQGLVSQLVAAERAPVANRLARQESAARLELSAFGRLKDTVAGLDTRFQTMSETSTLEGRSVTVEDEEIFTATVSSGAALGTYDIQVEQLAQSHRMATVTPIVPPDAPVGFGTLDLQLGSDAFSVEIDPGAQSLVNIRDAINNQVDNPGIVASIINVDGGAILQLGSDRSGSDSEIQISAGVADPGLTAFVALMDTSKNFQDAIVYINGNQVTSSSNSISSAIEGVVIDLKKALPGEAKSLQISRDQTDAVASMDGFISSYNTLVDVIKALGNFDPATGSSGPLNGDSVLRGLSNQLRVSLSANFGDGSIQSLLDLGITTAVDGKLSLDQSKLTTALSQDFNGVQSFLTGENGFAETLSAITSAYIGDDGLIDSRTASLDGRLERVDEKREALDYRLERIEARYLKQFSALDAMLSQLQLTSNYLSQQLASLPGVAKPKSS